MVVVGEVESDCWPFNPLTMNINGYLEANGSRDPVGVTGGAGADGVQLRSARLLAAAWTGVGMALPRGLAQRKSTVPGPHLPTPCLTILQAFAITAPYVLKQYTSELTILPK